jgi:hypothetical protein
MSALATQERRYMQRSMPGLSTPNLFDAVDPSRSSLEDVVLGSWTDLISAGRASCPVCGGDLHPVGCTDCGSQLS